MDPKKLLTTLTIVSVVLIAGCKQDDFVEIVGVCPEVISTIPADLAAGVPLGQIITATFNEAMNPVTINATSYTIKQGTTAVTGTVTYTGTTASFTPSSPAPLRQTLLIQAGLQHQLKIQWVMPYRKIMYGPFQLEYFIH